MKLGLRLGKTDKELLSLLDSEDIARYKAFDRIYPIDDIERLELAIAIVAQTIANKGLSPNAEPYKASDFRLDYFKHFQESIKESEDNKLSAEQLWNQLDFMALKANQMSRSKRK